MKRTILLGVLLCACISTLYAQSGASLKGIVHNAMRHPLEKATVAVLLQADSSVIAYTLTDKDGTFKLVRLPSQKALLLTVSHIDGNPLQRALTLKDKEVLDLDTLALAASALEEVLVTASPPIRMNKDTLEYNSNYFKTLPNANVEELLKQLPGLQVNMDGSIYYEGQEVSNVKVNGRDFFATDKTIATRNLDASLVKTVQVYRDRGESKTIVANERDLPITINLKFKKDFLRTDFGKAYGSGGTRGRYEAGALFNTFRDTLQLSFIGFGNNINRQSFEYTELSEHAGLGRAENYGFDNFGGRNYWGIGDDKAAGFNLNNDFGKKTKLNLMYMMSHSRKYSETQGNSQSLFDGETQFSDNSNNNEERSLQNNVRMLLRHRVDSNAYIEFTPSLALTNRKGESSNFSSSATDDRSLTENNSTGNLANRSLGYSHGLYLEKQVKGKQVLSLRNDLNINNAEIEDISDQHATLFQNEDPFNRILSNTMRKSRTDKLGITASYANKRLKKVSFEYYLRYSQSRERPLETLFVDRNNTGATRLSAMENSFDFRSQLYITGLQVVYNPSQHFSVNANNAFQLRDNDFDFLDQYPQVRNRNAYWLPNISVRLRNVQLSWVRSQHPPMTSMFRVNDYSVNPLFIHLRSLLLDNFVNDNYQISYHIYNQKTQFNISASLASADKSYGTRSLRNAQTGVYTTQAFLAAGTHNLSANSYARFQLLNNKKWNIYLSNHLFAYNFQRFSSINNVDNMVTTLNANVQQEVSFRWNNLIALSPSYTYNYTKNLNSVKDNPDFIENSYDTHRFMLGFNVNPIHGFSLESSYALDNRASGLRQRQNFNILNASIYYGLKNKGQIKLSGFDILNQNVATYWGTTGNSTYFGDQLTLRQYFLLGYVHKFNYVKTK